MDGPCGARGQDAETESAGRDSPEKDEVEDQHGIEIVEITVDANSTLLTRARMPRGIMVRMQNVASMLAAAAYGSSLRSLPHRDLPALACRSRAVATLIFDLSQKLIHFGQNALDNAVDAFRVGMDAVLLHEAGVERHAVEEEGVKQGAVTLREIPIDPVKLIDIVLAHIARRFHADDEHRQAFRFHTLDNLGERGFDLCRRKTFQAVVAAKLYDDRARICGERPDKPVKSSRNR